ncbi:MAG: hypothetical protein KUG51_00590 [Urechidicola sp.]|nr:hypothetical protein [Urechidicola sp.]
MYKIGSFLLAIVVLFSTFSFTVSSHFCGNILVDSSIFSEVEDCGMDMSHNDDCDSEENGISCNENDLMHCKNVTNSLEGNTIEQQAFENSDLPKVFFAISFLAHYENLLVDKNEIDLSIIHYKPLLVYEDTIVLYENFRI